jgi:hypothetical protein
MRRKCQENGAGRGYAGLGFPTVPSRFLLAETLEISVMYGRNIYDCCIRHQPSNPEQSCSPPMSTSLTPLLPPYR